MRFSLFILWATVSLSFAVFTLADQELTQPSTAEEDANYPPDNQPIYLMRRNVANTNEEGNERDYEEESMGKRSGDNDDTLYDAINDLAKRSMAMGRTSLRPGKRSSDFGRMYFRPAKRTVAFGRNAFRPGKRSSALARMNFRPGKRSLTMGRSSFRPGKRSSAIGRLSFRPGKRSIAVGRLQFRPGKRSISLMI